MTQSNSSWDDLGRNIQSAVERAVNSKNYQQLNQTIRQAVKTGSNAIEHATASIQAAQKNKQLYCSTFGKRLAGFMKILGGSLLALLGGTAFLGALMTEGAFTETPQAVCFVILIFFLGVWLIIRGGKNMAMLNRFKTYRGVLGQKTHCPVKMLACSIMNTDSYVRKDLQQMFKKGFFLEGHLDKEQANLITSHETYLYYEQSRMQLEAQQQKAATKHETSAPRDPQVQEVLDRGTAFIAQIRKCNDDIPGQEISEKIAHIELLVQRIFQRAQAHPEIVPDLKKLMDYYLPMTVKLLNAYADMDAQPIQGETIANSKREIEATLDTLTFAFEKLLDDLFADTAMDVSSDISVLNTLLAQEGLTEDDFSKLKPQQ